MVRSHSSLCPSLHTRTRSEQRKSRMLCVVRPVRPASDVEGWNEVRLTLGAHACSASLAPPSIQPLRHSTPLTLALASPSAASPPPTAVAMVNIRNATIADLMEMQNDNLFCLPENYQMKSVEEGRSGRGRERRDADRLGLCRSRSGIGSLRRTMRSHRLPLRAMRSLC